MAGFIAPPLSVDNMTLQQSAAGILSVKNGGIGLLQLADGANVSKITLWGGTGVGATVNYIGTGQNATEAKVRVYVREACVIRKAAYMVGAGAGTTGTCTIRKNGVDTLNTAAIASGS